MNDEIKIPKKRKKTEGRRSYKGRFIPKNPKKYKGDVSNIIFRSLWERKVFVDLDENPNVLLWSSEEIIIPYKSPKDNDWHRYFVDILMTVKDKNGNIQTYLLEIKPEKETLPPKPRQRKTKQYLNEVLTYGVNQAKWIAAQSYCEKKNWIFKVITEKHIFPKR